MQCWDGVAWRVGKMTWTCGTGWWVGGWVGGWGLLLLTLCYCHHSIIHCAVDIEREGGRGRQSAVFMALLLLREGEPLQRGLALLLAPC